MTDEGQAPGRSGSTQVSRPPPTAFTRPPEITAFRAVDVSEALSEGQTWEGRGHESPRGRGPFLNSFRKSWGEFRRWGRAGSPPGGAGTGSSSAFSRPRQPG